MMASFANLAARPAMVVLGWSVILVLWQTAAVALLLAVWRQLRPRASSRAQYSAALGATAACAALALFTPIVLWSWSTSPTAATPALMAHVASGATRAAIATVGAVAPIPPAQGVMVLELGSRVGWLGLVWLAGVVLLGLRLFGGWLLAERVRRTAQPLQSRAVAECVLRMQIDAPVSAAIALLESSHVEAPVVIGWRRPAIVLPHDIADQLPTDALLPLVAHEMAHVARRDYLVNLALACVDVVLFFSPAVHWISRRVREAREYCCDDLAVRECGDRRTYVQALMAMAGLGTLHRTRPALGAAGPRLIVRIRRLLQEGEMAKVSAARIAAIVLSLVGVGGTGLGVAAASIERIALHRARHVDTSVPVPTDENIPINFAFEQPGSGVQVPSWIASGRHFCDSATIQNTNNVAIVEVTFVAVVENRGEPRTPVGIFTGGPVPTHVPAEGVASVSAGLLTPYEAATAKSGRIQVMCALQSVRFENGSEWQVTPNPAATTASEALGFPPSQIPRSLVVSNAGGTVDGGDPMCTDEDGQIYSPGAVVAIRQEPGRVARCVDGQWVEKTER